MLDHQEARIWADHHHDFTAAAVNLLDQLREAFAVLARIQYEAPWRRTSEPTIR